jgi:hypothetical protein
MLRRADPGFTLIRLQAFDIALQRRLKQTGGCGTISTQGRHLKPTPLETGCLPALQFGRPGSVSTRGPRAAVLLT